MNHRKAPEDLKTHQFGIRLSTAEMDKLLAVSMKLGRSSAAELIRQFIHDLPNPDDLTPFSLPTYAPIKPTQTLTQGAGLAQVG